MAIVPRDLTNSHRLEPCRLPHQFADKAAVRLEALLEAIGQALGRDRDALAKESALAALCQHYELLMPREREVMTLVVAGLST